MSTLNSTTEGRERFVLARRVLPYAIAAAMLIWVFYDLHPREVLQHIVVRDWKWMFMGITVSILTYVLQGYRWSLLLRPVARVRPMRATQAIYAGLFTNEMLPLRLGELARAYLIASWERIGIVPIIPSILVERLLDGVFLAVAFGLAAIAVRLPDALDDAGDVLGVLVLLGVAAFVLVVATQGQAKTQPQSPNRLLRSVYSVVQRLAGGLRAIGISARLYYAAVISMLMLASQIVALWLLMLSYGLQFPFVAAAVLFIIVSLGTAVPNAPGNVGTFQFFTVLGLALLGVDKVTAAGFSVVAFLALTLPMVTIGAIAFSLSGLKLAAVRNQLRFAWAQVRR